MWFRSSGCDLVAKRSSVLLKRRAVTGAFDVKIVFTELPFEFALAKITVDGGTASNLVVGVPFTRLGTALTIPTPLPEDYSDCESSY